jgi:tetratricopeptide (TPR) repeat protein
MKKVLLLLIFIFSVNVIFSQKKEEAEKLVDQGIIFHDKGDYSSAIDKYNQALELDKDNLLALAEKALTLNTLRKYDESIIECQKAIRNHPNENSLKTVYVTYGNALDALDKSEEAFVIYDEGLKFFPNYYQLYFNKGITYVGRKEYDKAIDCFQKVVVINPGHASSNNAIARLEKMNGKKIPSILSFCFFLITEPQSQRAKENLQSLKELLITNVSQKEDKSIAITVNENMLSGNSKIGKPQENDFSSTDLISTLDAANDFDQRNKDNTEVENFIRKFQTICSSLDETKGNNYGFYWEVYVPYFLEMKRNNLIQPFAYIVFASSETKDVNGWLDKNQKELNRFYDWSKKYKWLNK